MESFNMWVCHQCIEHLKIKVGSGCGYREICLEKALYYFKSYITKILVGLMLNFKFLHVVMCSLVMSSGIASLEN